MSLENWDNFANPDIRRQKVNNFLNHLLTIESDVVKQSVYIPAVELKETAQAFYLKFEIPGITNTKRQIDLELTPIAVIICGERTVSQDAEDEQKIYSDFCYGKWQRVIFLPAPIAIQEAIAEYTDGILNLVLFKTEAKPDN